MAGAVQSTANGLQMVQERIVEREPSMVVKIGQIKDAALVQ